MAETDWPRREGLTGPLLTQYPVELEILELAPFHQMSAHPALALHAQLDQYSAGRRITRGVGGVDAVQPQLLEAVADQFPRRLGGVAVSPVGDADPVAQFGMLMSHVRAQNGPAHQAKTAEQRDREINFVFVESLGDEF